MMWEKGRGPRMKARGHEGSAATQARCSDSVHEGCYYSCPTPSAGVSERENTRGVSLTHRNMFSGGFFNSKANFCLMSQQETQQKAWMNSGGGRGTWAPEPASSLCFHSLRQGPAPGSLAISWAWGASLHRNLRLLNER